MYKYWIKYQKGEEVRFISHLDLLRALERTSRRAGIPIAYSQGYNPHPKLSFATPLSVGIVSYGDYLEIELTENLEIDEIIKKMNDNLPLGIKFLDGKKLTKKVPTLGALVEATEYKVVVKSSGLKEKIEEILKNESIYIERRSKKGIKMVDILPLILKLEYKDDVLSMLLTTSSTANVKPKEVLSLLNINNPNVDKIETYCSKGDKLVTPLQWLDLV
ncbi:radical SAM-linked protein [Anaerobranca californiensis DSM 14826]|jgi:radical SAM-linked protein|uniref:Radical SAM-linked protein n=1 Tax=Anaerobranca californiensis DSM 14826 TaxID=1120989 RepID=A0A1M6NI59_9FIRM|nr:TIGR03936 family radical SAM-associated protein [Anaerobranca californiensis]SHJ95377.1 radical SAM-linked protein [Anaerobranca californiensis DSM 14826]